MSTTWHLNTEALVAFAAVFVILWWSGKWQHDCYLERQEVEDQ